MVTGLATDSAVVTEEIFGPVLAVVVFDTEDETIALANDTLRSGSLGLDIEPRSRTAGFGCAACGNGVGQHRRRSLDGHTVRRIRRIGIRSGPVGARDRQVHRTQDHLDRQRATDLEQDRDEEPPLVTRGGSS